MVPNKWTVKIYQPYTKYHNTVYMFGDTNQYDPVEDGSQIRYDYMSSVTMKEMCPNRQYLEYTKDSSRYDKKTYSILDKFQEFLYQKSKTSSHLMADTTKTYAI